MKKLQNTLYLSTQGSYLHKERETLVVEHDGKKLGQLPMHALGNIVCFGRIMVSPALMAATAEKGIGLTFLTEYGKFLARVQGPQSGNVLLRRAQYRLADDAPITIARHMIAAKVENSRQVVMRATRNHGENPVLTEVAKQLKNSLRQVQHETDLDRLRGIEGDAAHRYFRALNEMIRPESKAAFTFEGRNKRPPTDPINALLSFAYTLLTHEISSALQTVGLDPYVGFLHRDRPGRVSLALDMLEEFRAPLCDRFVLSLINRKQVKKTDFVVEASGAVLLKNKSRKVFLTAWQDRKQNEITHPYINEKMPIGLAPYIQSQLLARFLRNDIEFYPPFVIK